MPNKLGKTVYYHLSCNYCGKDWTIDESFPRYCPFCGRPHFEEKDYTNCAFGQTIITDDVKTFKKCQLGKNCSSCDKWMVKDCTTCNHGHFNDRFNTYFCDGDLVGECKEWNLWEAKK